MREKKWRWTHLTTKDVEDLRNRGDQQDLHGKPFSERLNWFEQSSLWTVRKTYLNEVTGQTATKEGFFKRHFRSKG